MSAQTPTVGGCNVFPANNIWNTPIDTLPVDSNSAAYVSSMGTTGKLHPDYGATGGFPYMLVTGTQPKVNITFRYQSDPGPYPIPLNAPIEGGAGAGGDRHVIVIDNTNCILYELFSAYPQADGTWEAGSGAIFPMNSNKLRPNGWTSADAAGLPVFPGLIRYDEILSGHINHAICMSAQHTRNTWIWPGRHEASFLSGLEYPPMGQRFRLKKSFDISRYPARVQVILQALKTYGAFITDNGTSWHVGGVIDPRWNDNEMHSLTQVLGQSFEAVDESSLMMDANSAEAGARAVSKPPSGWVNIVAKSSGKCLSTAGGLGALGDGVLAVQWTCLGALNEEFQFSPVSGGYQITVRHSGLALDVRGGPTNNAESSLVQQWQFWGGSNQVWNLSPTSDGYYMIVPNSSGQCLNVKGDLKTDGANIQQYACVNADNNKWSFVPAS